MKIVHQSVRFYSAHPVKTALQQGDSGGVTIPARECQNLRP